MIDYFAALKRSAGPVREARQPHVNETGLVEAHVERVSDTAAGTPGVPGNEPTVHAESAELGVESVAPAGPALPSQPAAPLRPARAAALPEDLAGNAAVNAALRWVAADPARQLPPVSGIIDERARRAEPHDVGDPPRSEAPGSAGKTTDSIGAEPAWIEVESMPLSMKPNNGPPMRRAQSSDAGAAVVDSIAEQLAATSFLQNDRVEVSIGTIHVRVDAPTPKVIAQQRTAQPSQPKPEPRDERSSFSRSRIPRI